MQIRTLDILISKRNHSALSYYDSTNCRVWAHPTSQSSRAGYEASSYMCAFYVSLVESTESFTTNGCPIHALQAMDPISITASAGTIIQMTFELITGIKSYYKSVKGSSKEVADLLQELESFGFVLESLKGISQKMDRATRQIDQFACDGTPQQETFHPHILQKMLEADGPLSLCYNEMLDFRRKLTRHQSNLNTSLKWPFKKAEIKAVVNRLRNLKSLLDTAIHRENL